jgi:glucose-1-phosphate adenylyltransferase
MTAMRKQMIGMVLAGGRVDELLVLTATRPKSAVPVWGMYRVIDFVLSNLMYAGIEVVGVLSQYRPYSLITHLANGEPWDYVGRARALRILSPFKGADDSDWYKGTADALYQNLGFIERYSPELVLVVAGDHVYSMDYRPMIRQHLATRADLTIAFKRVPRDQAHRYGTAVLDEARRVVTYQEKVKHPAGDLASLTIYVFNTQVLVDRLRQNAEEGRTFHVYSEIIPRMVEEQAKVFGWVFDGYWQYARTLDDYYATNMDILGASAPDLAAWPVRTNLAPGSMGDHPPALFQRGAGARASLVCDGSALDGIVERSIISPGVTIERGAVVRDSVILHECRVEAGAILDRVILDKRVRVGRGAHVGEGDTVSNARHPDVLSCGVTVVGKESAIPAGMRIGRGCVISPGLREADFAAAAVPSGATVLP